MKRLYLFLVGLFLLPVFVFSEKISWNTRNNFLSGIYKTENVELVSDGAKSLYYKIKKQSYNFNTDDNDVDLFMPFDAENKQKAVVKNYETLQKSFQYKMSDSYIGTCAYFYKNEHKIELQGNKKSVFVPGRVIGSFTINFYIYPMNLSENNVLFKIGSHYYENSNDSICDQSFSAVLDEGVFKCQFRNVFNNEKNKPIPEFTVKAYQRIMPQEWTNLTITYDSFSGVIKLFINGVENGIAKAAGESVYPMIFNPANRCILDIGTAYVGAIDDFLIKHGTETEKIERGFAQDGAVIVSTVQKLDDFNIVIKDINFLDYEKDGAEVKYFARFSSAPFDVDDTVKSIKPVEWIALNEENISYLKNKKAAYFQWKALLLPGVNGYTSPHFSGINLEYEKDFPPSPPSGVKIAEKDGTIFLKWKNNTEQDLKGYKIYYGTKPGVYFCNDAAEGESPIIIDKVDNFKLTKLKKNLIYYITVTAFDDKNANHESAFSEEVSKRVY